jgi:hypothetical protein
MNPCDVEYIVIWLNDQARLLLNETLERKEEQDETSRERLTLYKSTSFSNIGYDTEDNSKGHCHLLVFVTELGEKYIFKDRHAAIFWLVFSDFVNDQVIWCVNTEYDLNNLLGSYHYLLQRLYNKSRFIMGRFIDFLPNRSIVKFYDLVNFYSLSAASVGRLFDFDKLHFDFSKRRFTKDGTVKLSKEELTYCIRDAEIAQIAGSFISDKFREYNIRFAPTVASCAMQIFLKHYDSVGLMKLSESNGVVPPKCAHASYYGGRVEAFRIGERIEGNIRYYDINSLYPFVMRRFRYPNIMAKAHRRTDLNFKVGFVACNITVPLGLDIGPLPTKIKDRLTFPVGTFDGVWCMPEIINAIKMGSVVNKVYWAYSYERVCYLFRSYIDDMYRKRQDSTTKADNKFYKVLMNSLYGKFGQKVRLTSYVPVCELTDLTGMMVGDYIQHVEQILGSHERYIVASYVTSYARYILFSWMMKVKDAGGELLYCDTDSIIYRGGNELPTSPELGAMKLEAEIDWITIRGNKYYEYGTTDGQIVSVVKGIPKYAQHEMFVKGQATYKKPIRYKESLRRQLQSNVWIDITKKSLTKYDKRVILKDGRTKPITVF